MKHFILHIFIVLCWLTSGAQKTFTWQECAIFALENNADIKISSLKLQKQNINIKQAGNAFLPSVRGHVKYDENYGRSIDPENNDIIYDNFFTNQYNINVSLDIFKGMTRINKLRFEKYNYELCKTRKKRLENLIVFEILEEYCFASYLHSIRKIQLEQIEVSQKALNKSKRMYELGLVPGSTIVEMEAQLAGDSLKFATNEIKLFKAMQRLRKQMNYPIGETLGIAGINITDSIITGIGTETEIIVETACENSLKIQMSLLRLQALDKQISGFKGEMLPKLSLYAAWNSGYYETMLNAGETALSFGEQIRGNERKYVGLMLSFPVFNQFSYSNKLQHLKINRKISQTEYNKQIAAVRQEVMENIQEISRLKREYEAAFYNYKKQKAAFATAQKKLDKGIIDIIAYGIIKNRCSIAYSRLIIIKLNLFLAHKTINFHLTGKIL